ncbi:hypothetical protein GCM10022255_112160 [Dactylosporangium darangshiense]|uniref:Uncharacterized protein n=1 Tax=Dactylosporangium darangshiense TaxID=579108 RepID=A0ABP8DV53_9ACTN
MVRRHAYAAAGATTERTPLRRAGRFPTFMLRAGCVGKAEGPGFSGRLGAGNPPADA